MIVIIIISNHTCSCVGYPDGTFRTCMICDFANTYAELRRLSCISRPRYVLCNEAPRGSMQSDHVSFVACVIGFSMFIGIVLEDDKIKVSYI
jgi:hypothetical protein